MSRRNTTFLPKVGETGVGETGVGEQGITPTNCHSLPIGCSPISPTRQFAYTPMAILACHFTYYVCTYVRAHTTKK